MTDALPPFMFRETSSGEWEPSMLLRHALQQVMFGSSSLSHTVLQAKDTSTHAIVLKSLATENVHSEDYWVFRGKYLITLSFTDTLTSTLTEILNLQQFQGLHKFHTLIRSIHYAHEP